MSFRITRSVAAALLLFAAPIPAFAAQSAAPAAAQPAGASAIRDFVVTGDHHEQNKASFTSKALFVEFSGTTSQMNGDVKVPVQDVAKASGSMTVDLTSLDTGIAMRNQHMRGFLETDKYPTGTFVVQKISVPGNKLKPNAEVAGTATGKMTLHGVTRTITVPVQLAFLPQLEENEQVNDWLRISSSFKLKMSDYGIKLPQKILGMRVNDELNIDFNTVAKAL